MILLACDLWDCNDTCVLNAVVRLDEISPIYTGEFLVFHNRFFPSYWTLRLFRRDHNKMHTQFSALQPTYTQQSYKDCGEVCDESEEAGRCSCLRIQMMVSALVFITSVLR